MRRPKGATRGRKLRPAQAPSSTAKQTPFQREQTTKRRGEISELAFALAAARHGFGISRPYGDSERYDIILDCPINDPGHLTSVISTEAERKRAQRGVCPEPAEGDLLFAPARPRLVRVQVKASAHLLFGQYHVTAQRKVNGRAVPYKLSEIDFIAAYIIPEDSWFILPLAHILGQTSLLFRPERSRKPSPYDPYREAWHLLHEPDGLEFA
jgi:hypothetical protein